MIEIIDLFTLDVWDQILVASLKTFRLGPDGSPKLEAGREFASNRGWCIAVLAISDGDHAAVFSMMVSFISYDRKVFVEMLKPAAPSFFWICSCVINY